MRTYTVQNGDSLWKIARANNIGLDALIAANPQISDPNYILAGSQINIPELWQMETLPAPDPAPPAVNGQTTPNYTPDFVSCANDPSVRPCIYTARQGDTLEGIGQLFMVPLTRLLYYNLSFSKSEPLPEGARIIIPEMEIWPVDPYCQRHQGRRRK